MKNRLNHFRRKKELYHIPNYYIFPMIDYIIYITDKNILNVSSQKDFSQKYKFSISENFIPLTSSIVADKGKLKYQKKYLIYQHVYVKNIQKTFQLE